MKKILSVLLLANILLSQNLLSAAGNQIEDSKVITERLRKVLAETTDGKNVHGTSFRIFREGDGKGWRASSGVFTPDTQYPIASITKMFTSAVLMQLNSERKISLDDKISKYLPEEYMVNLHVFDGKDYSQELTIRDLLSNRSGLPDYFLEPTGKYETIFDMRKNGNDVSYTLEDILKINRDLTPHFPPNTSGKAYYSDTNFQILGEIIKNATGKDLDIVYKERIFNPLGMKKSYLKTDDIVWGIAPVYDGEKAVEYPKILKSERSTGGIVSTAEDQMKFIKAFFGGELFPKKNLEQMEEWTVIELPMEYGLGIMKFDIGPFVAKLPKEAKDSFNGMTDFVVVGHSGSVGTVDYYYPAGGIYITGMTSQFDKHAPITIVYKILASFYEKGE